jgi:Asp-tRNA(Asn)/Glu-tRNA(Gln) amidotransferase A subunit family amidase
MSQNEDETHANGSITEKTIAEAEKINHLNFTDAERKQMLERLNDRLENYEKLRAIKLDNSVPPALYFDPRPPGIKTHCRNRCTSTIEPIKLSSIPLPPVPSELEEMAFYPLTHLSMLIRTRKVTSKQLTEMYLRRLKRYDPYLHCVVTLTEELALTQAKRADDEMAQGIYRGPLHGIPWGAKDLLATKGIPTTWGAKPYEDQVIDTNATVVERLEEAGAVLVAKLSMGALAQGDVWFKEKTRNPWNLDEGSSGSSAGPGSAVAAGLVGFAIGTETLGSIVSPCKRCGVTGLRPSFGRVSRYGAMALSWSMDKIGPICRTVEDCAVVFGAIKGPDCRDLTVVNELFTWDPNAGIDGLKVGFLEAAFEADEENKAGNEAMLESLRNLGLDLAPIELPDYPVLDLAFLLRVEAAAAFDELTMSGLDELLVSQEDGAWPNIFRAARFVPAVEYIQANRIRTLIIQEMAELMENVDVYVAPASDRINLTLTNLTGHPTVVVPSGLSEEGVPNNSVTFTGRLYGEAEALILAKAYQETTEFHLKHPLMEYGSE